MAMTKAEELAQEEARLTEYKASELRILKSQSWQKGGTAAQRASLKEVRQGIKELTASIRRLSQEIEKGTSGARTRLAVISED